MKVHILYSCIIVLLVGGCFLYQNLNREEVVSENVTKCEKVSYSFSEEKSKSALFVLNKKGGTVAFKPYKIDVADYLSAMEMKQEGEK